MSAAQHTPGPWAMYPGSYRASFVVPALDLSKKLGGADDIKEDLNNYAQEVCAIEDHHRHRTVEEQRANARLIAAAPELLAELQEVLEWAVKERAPLRKQEIASISALIAKATGEQA